MGCEFLIIFNIISGWVIMVLTIVSCSETPKENKMDLSDVVNFILVPILVCLFEHAISILVNSRVLFQENC